MANLARFRINQSTTGTFGYARRDILPTSETVELQLEAENSGLVYLWEVIQPPGSAVTIGSATSQFATFAAEQDGGYIVKLTVNPGSADEDVDSLYFGIGTDIDGERYCLPALNETVQDNSLGHPEWGWWEKIYIFLRQLASLAGTGGGGDTFFESGSGSGSLQRKDFSADAQGDLSYALGSSATAVGASSWAFGNNSITTGGNSAAFGRYSVSEGDNSFAFAQFGTAKEGSTIFGIGYVNAIHHSLAVGCNNVSDSQIVDPQTMRIPLNGRTTSAGVSSRLYIDTARNYELGPIPAYSFLTIGVHVVAKSDMPDGSAPALVTFDGEVQAIATASGITYQDWTIVKNMTAGTPEYAEGAWDLSIPLTSPSLDYLELTIVQDSTNAYPNVIWSGYADIAIVSTTGGAPS
jgi:hypothetical protein